MNLRPPRGGAETPGAARTQPGPRAAEGAESRPRGRGFRLQGQSLAERPEDSDPWQALCCLDTRGLACPSRVRDTCRPSL